MRNPKSPSPIDIKVGKRIRVARCEAGLTQQDLGRITNRTFQQIQKYEAGQNRISAGVLFEISNRLDRPLNWFFAEC